jgi:hypothetical protein
MGALAEFALLTYTAARDAVYLFFEPLVQLWDWLSQESKSVTLVPQRSFSFLPSRLSNVLIPLRSHLLVARLMFRARRVKVNRLRKLLIDLELRRQYLRPLWEASPPFRDYVSEMMIFVVRGQETPLATLVFSDALTALGFRTRTYEDFPEIWELFRGEFRKLPRFTRLAIVIGQGIEEASKVRLLSDFSPDLGVDISAVPLFQLSQSGVGLFPDVLLYDLLGELRVDLKDYLQKAASLAKRPFDKQFEDRAKHASQIHR